MTDSQDGHYTPDWCRIGERTTVQQAQTASAGWGTYCLQPAAAKDTRRELTAADNRIAERSRHLQLQDRRELEDTRIREQEDMRIREQENSQLKADKPAVAVADRLAAEDSRVGEGSRVAVDTRQPAVGSRRRSRPDWDMARMS